MKGPAFQGKTALVTGASGLIGREIALSLAAEGAGIVVHYRRSRREAMSICRKIEALGAAAWPVMADLAVSESAVMLVRNAVRRAGKLDLLVNSASVFTRSSLLTLDETDLEGNMKVNAWAPFALCRAFSRTAARGAIVNLLDSRIAGGDRSHAGYIISKHVLWILTRLMALEFSPSFTVNAVAPGLVTRHAGTTVGAGKLPLGRSATPADVAEAVVFLLKNRCITGQVVWVDGGRHARESVRQIIAGNKG